MRDVYSELDALARKYPKLVRPLTLANRTVLGRPIRGIEITKNAANIRDGKPVFLMMGAHHAREWPSVEHSMEFAYDLLEKSATDPRAKRIVEGSRTIIVPVVNVDGYVISRSAAPIGNFGTFDYEMKRKNCSISVFTPPAYTAGSCDDNPAGRLRGTDLNRNYPGFWGGPGASATWSSDTYRGDAPGDTPEVDAVKTLISQRQVTNLISNHTYSNLVLRPPSLLSTGFAPDEPQYKALGASMAAANDYLNWAVVPARTTPPARWRTGATGRPAGSGSPSRSVRTGSTRPTRTPSSPSTSASSRQPVPARAATGRRTTGWPRPPSTPRTTRPSPARRRPGGC